MCAALRGHIGKICHVYLDDIIIWSASLEDHKWNVALILKALCAANLYCSPKKTQLFCTLLKFLGHHISSTGIEANVDKVTCILNWPVPGSSSDVRSFLGLVRYISVFLPSLTEHTACLTPLTTKDAECHWPRWTATHQCAFCQIQKVVVGCECLMVIDHENPGDNCIFVTCDTSMIRTGACLSFGPTWESARPVAFDSMQLTPTQTHYPTHEQELLAIVHALHWWHFDLLRTPFTIRLDHCMLEHFMRQPDLSCWQARWSEFLSQYDFTIEYIPGSDNATVDALSQLPINPGEMILDADPAEV